MADTKKSTPAPTAGPMSSQEWKQRLDEGAARMGIGATQQPPAGFQVGGMPGMPGMPGAQAGAQPQMPGWPPPPYYQPMGYPPPYGAAPGQPMAPPAPFAEEPSGLGSLIESTVELLTAGVGAARQIVQAVSRSIPNRPPSAHEAPWGAPPWAHPEHGGMPMPGCGGCGAANCGAYPPYSGSCMQPSFPGCPSSVRPG
jgi:hypothetical protein